MNHDDSRSAMIPPGVPYHRVLAKDERRIGRGVLALVLLLVGLFGFGGLLSYLGSLLDASSGRSSPISGGTEFTPVYQAANLVSIALLVPWSMLIQRRLYGVRGASLHSVRSVFRFDVLGRALVTIGPIWTVYMVVLFVLSPYQEAVWRLGDLLWLVAITLLLTPLQAAGEEYGLRGLAFRIAAGWGRGPRTALVIGTAVSSLVFMSIHVSTDPWLNLYYLTFAVTLCLIAWRTGGLETGIVIHSVNNTLAYLIAIAAHSDLVAGSDRSAGAGSVVMLLPCGILVAITAVVCRRTRRAGPARTPAVAARPVAAATAE